MHLVKIDITLFNLICLAVRLYHCKGFNQELEECESDEVNIEFRSKDRMSSLSRLCVDDEGKEVSKIGDPKCEEFSIFKYKICMKLFFNLYFYFVIHRYFVSYFFYKYNKICHYYFCNCQIIQKKGKSTGIVTYINQLIAKFNCYSKMYNCIKENATFDEDTVAMLKTAIEKLWPIMTDDDRALVKTLWYR